MVCRAGNRSGLLSAAHKVHDLQTVAPAEQGLGKTFAGQDFSVAFNDNPCRIMPACCQKSGNAAWFGNGFGFPVDCDIHTRLQRKTAAGLPSEVEVVMVLRGS